jgi:uncharacterized protein (TIGR03000 family)
MRKTICILSLVAVTLVASASDVFAQRRGGGGGGGGRRGGVSIGIGGGYYGSPYGYGGRGYYYGSPYYDGGSSYSYAPDYYATPYYPNVVTQAPSTEIRQSFYADPNSATITVIVPNADAQVWFDDSPTSQRGTERMFHTPTLQRSGTYTIKARWTENGRTVDQQRQVQVQPGQSAIVNFRNNATETLPSPKN